MRRFIRTFYARRRAQVFVIQDGEARCFELWVWRAEDRGPVYHSRYTYEADHKSIAAAREVTAAAGLALATTIIDEAPLAPQVSVQ